LRVGHEREVQEADTDEAARAALDRFRESVIPSQHYGITLYEPTPEDRWASASPTFQAEQPWCGWTMAFAHGSDWDTTSFGLERLVNLNVLLTTADGRSRPVSLRDWQHIIDPSHDAAYERNAGIRVRELDTDDYEPLDPSTLEFVAYEDIREIVVY
jgi:hypothetical protein